MRDYWATNATSPNILPLCGLGVDCTVNVCEFYLILKAAGATKSLMWKLIFLSVIMLVTGYFGEAVHTTGQGPALWGLVSGLAYFAIVEKFGKVELPSLQKLQVEPFSLLTKPFEVCLHWLGNLSNRIYGRY